jgi:hypothetical protein
MQVAARRTRLIYLAVIVGTAVVMMPVCAALGYSPGLPLLVLFVAFLALGAVMLAYLVVVLSALLLVFMVSVPLMWIRGYRAYRRLAGSLPPERRATWKRLGELAAETPGTLIREGRSLGWSTEYVWWTPRDVAADAAAAGIEASTGQTGMSEAPDPLTPFCVERYLHRERGGAILIDANTKPIGGFRLSRRMRAFRAAHPRTGEQIVCELYHAMLVAAQQERADGPGGAAR